MIKPQNLSQCNGCCGCEVICPVDECLVMDRSSFLTFYPGGDESVCIHCAKCVKICAYKSQEPVSQKALKLGNVASPGCFAARSLDERARAFSGTGGMFYELASEVLSSGGEVCGAVYRDDFSVAHEWISDIKELEKLCCSKYTLSDLRGAFKGLKEKVKEGKKLLICAAPCQIHALAGFFNFKVPKNLLLVEFVCMGTSKPLLWQKYLEFLSDKFGSKITQIRAKDKSKGWQRWAMSASFESGAKYFAPLGRDAFSRALFVEHLGLMDACYECAFKGFARLADITLADFWGVDAFFSHDDRGLNLVLINNEKGKEAFFALKNIWSKEVELNAAIRANPATHNQVKTPSNLADFNADLLEMDFKSLYKKYFSLAFKARIKEDIMRFLSCAKRKLKAIIKGSK